MANYVTALPDTDSSKKPKLITLYSKLPYPNRETLKFLADHFRLVAKNSTVNKMHEENIERTLGIMYGTTISRFVNFCSSFPTDFNYFRAIRSVMDDPSICPSTIVFGNPLEDAAANSDPNKLIPAPLKVCIEFIEKGVGG